MKLKLTILIGILLVITSCNDSEKETTVTANTDTEEKLSLKGSWELKGFYNYQNNIVVDSFSNNTIARQIKMFSDTRVMWCKLRPTDSTEFFGYGSYTYDDGHLIEILEFGSSFMNEVIAEQKEFKFQLEIHPDRFEQIELDEDGNKIYSENYIRIE